MKLISKNADIMKLERLTKALANRRRIVILRYLVSLQEATVNDIANEISLSFRATSKHLTILTHCNILEREQRSKFVFYRLTEELHPLVKYFISFL